MPAPQSPRQKEFEARVKQLGNALAKKQGLSRRRFFQTPAGMASAFVAMNQTRGVVLGLGALSSHLKSGALKAIAISSRFADLPNVPTLTELGYRQEIQGVWLAFFGPAHLPAEVAQTLVAALERSARNPETTARLQAAGIVQDWLPAQKLAAEIVKEHAAVSEIAKRMQAPRRPSLNCSITRCVSVPWPAEP